MLLTLTGSNPDALPLFSAGEISAKVSAYQPKTHREQEPVSESGVTSMTTEQQVIHIQKSVCQAKIQKGKAGTKQGLAKDKQSVKTTMPYTIGDMPQKNHNRLRQEAALATNNNDEESNDGSEVVVTYEQSKAMADKDIPLVG